MANRFGVSLSSFRMISHGILIYLRGFASSLMVSHGTPRSLIVSHDLSLFLRARCVEVATRQRQAYPILHRTFTRFALDGVTVPRERKPPARGQRTPGQNDCFEIWNQAYGRDRGNRITVVPERLFQFRRQDRLVSFAVEARRPKFRRTGVFAAAMKPSAAEAEADSLILFMKLEVMTHSGRRCFPALPAAGKPRRE